MGKKDITEKTLDHINAVLELLNVMDKDHRFETKLNKSTGKGEAKTMSEWLTKVLDESENKGRKEGLEEGALMSMMKLIKQGLISVTQAADAVGMTTEEFEKKAAAYA